MAGARRTRGTAKASDVRITRSISAGLIGLALTVPSPASAAELEARTVVGGLDFATGIGVLPDGRIVVNERSGRVLLVDGGEVAPDPLAVIPTTTSGETGLLDIAVPSDFDEDPAVYVFATEADGSSNSVWRVPVDGSGAERVITNIPSAVYHDGGGLVFGRDGMLYVSNGEGHESERAQDPAVLGGKIYRFNPDGSIPGDGPFEGNPNYALGLRNPFGLTIDPVTGDLWATENGPSSFDEVNHITRGGNYGWPNVSGPGCDEGCIDPVLAYESIIVPTGIAFAGADAPPEFAGNLFLGTYGEASIHRVTLNTDRTQATSDEIVYRSDEPVIGMEWGLKGLYFTTPSALKLISLAAEKPKPSASPSANKPAAEDTPAPSASPAPAGGEGGNLTGVGAIILALLAAAFFSMRSRMSRQIDSDLPPGSDGK